MAPKAKSKKKGKSTAAAVTGPPEVVNFKSTPLFSCIKSYMQTHSAVVIPTDREMDDAETDAIQYLLTLVNLMFTHTHTQKTIISRVCKIAILTHELIKCDFSHTIVTGALVCITDTHVVYNDIQYEISDHTRKAAHIFISQLTDTLSDIYTHIHTGISDDFKPSLTEFRQNFAKILKTFDCVWASFEQILQDQNDKIYQQVFKDVQQIVDVEESLTEAEEKSDVVKKQELETRLIQAIKMIMDRNSYCNYDQLPDDIVCACEALLFYKKRLKGVDTEVIKEFLHKYMKVRVAIGEICERGLNLDLKSNKGFFKALEDMLQAATKCTDATDMTRKLPSLVHVKTSNWMTKKAAFEQTHA